MCKGQWDEYTRDLFGFVTFKVIRYIFLELSKWSGLDLKI